MKQEFLERYISLRREEVKAILILFAGVMLYVTVCVDMSIGPTNTQIHLFAIFLTLWFILTELSIQNVFIRATYGYSQADADYVKKNTWKKVWWKK